VRSRGSDFDIPVVFSLIIALLRNKEEERSEMRRGMRRGGDEGGGTEREEGRKCREKTSFGGLVPSCFVIFDLKPLSLSLDFVFSVRDL
ncbi:hypothetical protein Tco_1197157, partial [Tanacetum coccineum]